MRARGSAAGSPSPSVVDGDDKKRLLDSPPFSSAHSPAESAKQHHAHHAAAAFGRRAAAGWRRWALLALLVAGGLLLLGSWDSAPDLSEESFVKVAGTQVRGGSGRAGKLAECGRPVAGG